MATVPPPPLIVHATPIIDNNNATSINTAITESCEFYNFYKGIFEFDNTKTVLLLDCANLINTLLNYDEFHYYSPIIEQTPTFQRLHRGHKIGDPSARGKLSSCNYADKIQIIKETFHFIKSGINPQTIVIFINNRNDYHNVINASPRTLDIVNDNPILHWGQNNTENDNIYYINIFCYNLHHHIPKICWPGDITKPGGPKDNYKAWHDLDDYMLLTLYWIFICNGFQNVFIISGDNYSKHTREILKKIRDDCHFCNGVNLKGKKKKYFNLKNITAGRGFIPETKLYRQLSLPDTSIDAMTDILPNLTVEEENDLETIFDYEKINDLIHLHCIHEIFGMTDRKLKRSLPIKFNDNNFIKFFENRSGLRYLDRTDTLQSKSFQFTLVEFKEYYKYLKQLNIGNHNLNHIKENYERIIRTLFDKCKKDPKRDNIIQKDRSFFKGKDIDFKKDTLYKTMTKIVNNRSDYNGRINNIKNSGFFHILVNKGDINYNDFKKFFLTLRQTYGGITWNKIENFNLTGGSRKTRKNRVVNNNTRKRK